MNNWTENRSDSKVFEDKLSDDYKYDENDVQLPQLQVIPIFNTNCNKSDELCVSSLSSLPAIKKLPHFVLKCSESIRFNQTIDKSINENIINNNSSVDKVIESELINELIEDFKTQNITVINNKTIIDNNLSVNKPLNDNSITSNGGVNEMLNVSQNIIMTDRSPQQTSTPIKTLNFISNFGSIGQQLEEQIEQQTEQQIIEQIQEDIDINNTFINKTKDNTISQNITINNADNKTKYKSKSVSTRKKTTLAININELSVKPAESANTNVVNVVNIDINDESNSPKNSCNIQFFPNETITYFKHFSSVKNCSQSCDSDTSQTITNSQQFGSQAKTMNAEKVAELKPLKYCARNYRSFAMKRHSSRQKKNDMNGENQTDWSQIDGTQYHCTITKWKQNDEMSEEKRKVILSQVSQMKFNKSIYKEDKGVFYSFSAFKSECNRNVGLKCMLKLDYKGVKHFRFNGDCVTKLFLLSGQALLISESGKQRKTVESGHQVLINKHTSYQLENNNVESCYFYVHVSSD